MNRSRGGKGKGTRSKRHQKHQKSKNTKTGSDSECKSNTASSMSNYTEIENYNYTPMSVKKEDLQKLVGSAFHNHVVVERLIPYLDFSSIKALSAVNQRLKWIVRGNKEFLDRCRIGFFKPEGGTRDPPHQLFRPSDFPFKTVAVQLHTGWRKKDLTKIYRLIPNVTSLELHSGDTFVESPGCEEMLLSLLRRTTNLKELSVDAAILDSESSEFFESTVMGNTDVQENLKHLDILGIRNSIRFKERYGILSAQNFSANIKLLGESPAALIKFGFDRIQQFGFDTSEPDPDKMISDSLVSVLQRHQQSLTSLGLDGSIWESVSFTSLVFPRLKDLNLTTCGTSLAKVVTFINKQPPLQSLQMKFDGMIAGGMELEPPLLKHGPHLKRFALVWNLLPAQPQGAVRDDDDDDDWDNENGRGVRIVDFFGYGNRLVPPLLDLDGQPVIFNPPPVPPSTFAFSCLKNFALLQKIKIRQLSSSGFENLSYGRGTKVSLGTILSLLPDGMEEIDIGGAPTDSRDNVIESLGRFRNLMVLNLIQCPGVINDEVLAFICSNKRSLIELGFSHCPDVTDYGLTGKQSGVAVVAGINALTGLRKLEITACPHVTRKGFLTGISFPDLRDLTLVTTPGTLNQQFYEEILKQNKGLELLTVSDSEMHNLAKLEKVMKKNSKRFRAVLFIPLVSDILTPSSDDEYYGSDFTSDMDDYYGSDWEFGLGTSDDEDADPDY